MEQPKFILKGGTRVVVHPELIPWESALDMTDRRPGARGEIMSTVGGYGGDCYHVKHDDHSVGMYCFTEFELEG